VSAAACAATCSQTVSHGWEPSIQVSGGTGAIGAMVVGQTKYPNDALGPLNPQGTTTSWYVQGTWHQVCVTGTWAQLYQQYISNSCTTHHI
jgi:hypothetical protein